MSSQKPTDKLAHGPAAHAPSNGDAAGAKPRILIVDDNADAANSLGRLLMLMGNEICVVHDGLSAIERITDFRPAVVLMDLGMPGMDGLETAERIRALPQGRAVALIAVTGWGQDRDRERTSQAGFAAHLTKPVNVSQLQSSLAEVLSQQGLKPPLMG